MHPPWITESLTWAEICARYPDQWISMVDIEREPPNCIAIRSGRVIGHGVTRKQALEQVDARWGMVPQIGQFFTGSCKPLLPRLALTTGLSTIR